MAEFITMQEAEDKFGKKGTAGAGLGLGIAGTALGLLNGGLGNILGGIGGNANAGVCATPSLWEICEKQNAENVALTSAIYQGRIKEMEDMAGLYERVNVRLIELEKKDAALAASLPLAMQLAACQSERYTDNKIDNVAKVQNEVNFIFQRELDKKINGTMGLPWGDIITGIPTMPRCTMGVTCPTSSTPA